jgi:hypothetical protein
LLTDDELAAHCPFGGDWDNFYIGVLAAIAAAPVRSSQAPASSPKPRQLQFSFTKPQQQ